MIVKRTYVNKKGEIVTKTYTYDRKKYKYDSKRYKNRVNKLTTKRGNKTKRYDNLLNKEFKLEDEVVKNYIDNTIKKYLEKKKVITVGQLKAMLSNNRLAIFLANFQLSADDILKDLQLKGVDISEDWLLDQTHWDFHKGVEDADITLPDGTIAFFTYNYDDHSYEIKIRLM